MADPLYPAGTQMGNPDPNLSMTPEEFDRQLAEAIAEANGQPSPVAQTAEAAPPQMTGIEEKVYSEGYDPYAASKQEKTAWEAGVKKVQDTERYLTGGLGLTEGFSPSAVVAGATDRFLTETGRSVIDLTNTVGLTSEDTRKKVGYADAGPVEEAMSGILAYVASFAGYNKFLKTAGVATNVVRWGLAGGAADAFGQDPFAEGFADLAKKSNIPGLDDNFVTEYFAATGNEDDGIFEARFKNALEGHILGVAVGKTFDLGAQLWGVFKSMKASYKAAATGDTVTATKALEAAVEQADVVAKETGQPFFDPEKLEWDSGSYYARRAAQAAPSNSPYDIKYDAPLDPTFQPQGSGALGDVSVTTPGPNAVAGGTFRSLEESMAALVEGRSLQDTVASQIGEGGVPVVQAGDEVAGTQLVTNMGGTVGETAGTVGGVVAKGTLPIPTAPRYSAFKTVPKETPAKTPKAQKPTGEAGKGGAKAGGAGTAKEAIAASGPDINALNVPRGQGVILSVSKDAAREFADNMGKDPDTAMASFEATFNTNRWGTADEVKEVIGQVADVMRKEGIKIDQKTTQKAIMELADMYMVRPEVLISKLAQLAKAADDMPSIVVATKMMAASLGKRLVESARKINGYAQSGMPTAEIESLFERDLSILEGLMPDLTLVRHRGAVATWAGNIQTVSTEVPEGVLRAIKQFPGDRRIAQLVIARLPATKVVEAAKRIMMHKSWDAIIQWRTGALLYGPRTMITNIVGTSMWSVAKPTLRVLGSLMMADGKTAAQNLRVLAGMRSATGDSLKMMKRAFVDHKGVLDASNGTVEQNNMAFQLLANGKGGDAMMASMRFLDGVSTLPMRALTSQDEFFKQISYRSFMKSKATSLAQEAVNGGLMPESQMDEWVDNYVKNSFDADGGALDTEGLQYAREATFTQDLGPWGQEFQRAANAIPILKIVFPFIRTPANLISEGIQMFPGANLLSKRWRGMMMSKDPAQRAEAAGKMAFGSMIMGTALYYSSQGQLIGRAPSDPKLLKIFQESGRLPYSFLDQSTGRWVQFNRMDPFAIPFGIAADLSSAFLHEGQDIGPAFAAAAIGIGDNLKNKSYLTGIADVADFIGVGYAQDDEQRASTFGRTVGKQAASFVPNFTSQLNPDDTLRETRGLMDQTLNRLWMFGGSAGIAPKRDMLGEPIAKNTGWMFGEVPNWLSPFTLALPANSPIKEQLLKAQYAYKHPPSKDGNIDMRDYKNASGQTAYDRYLELTGQVVDGYTGRTLKQELEDVVPKLQAEFGNIDPQVEANGWTYKSPVTEEVGKVLGQYRAMAKDQLIKEFPDLMKDLDADKIRKSAASRQDAAKLLQ
jgi:hypothetical protein